MSNSTPNTLKKNAYFIGAGYAISMGLSFVLVPVAARYLGEHGFGIYSLGMTVSGLVVMLSDAGINTFVTREVAKNNEDASKYYVNALAIKVLTGVASIGLVLFFSVVLGYTSPTLLVVIILSGYAVLNSITQLANSIFRAFEKMHFEMVSIVLQKSVTTSLGVAILVGGFGVVSFVSVFPIGAAIVVIFGLIALKRKFIPTMPSLNRKFAKVLFVNSLPFGASMVLITIYDKVDTLMLSKMGTMSDVGWYSAAYRLLSISSVIPTILISAVFPKMSRDVLKKQGELRVLYTKCFKYLLLMAVPLIVGGLLLSDKIILFFYGEHFRNSIPTFRILVWAVGIIFMNMLLGSVYRASDNQMRLLYTQICGVFVNIALNLAFIPRYFSIGAAISTVITEGLLFVAYFHFVTRHVCSLLHIGFILKAAVAAGLMILMILMMQSFSLFVTLMAGCTVYFGALYAMRAITIDEIILIKKRTKS